jgi:peptide/nickel transport system substrate-binding protein
LLQATAALVALVIVYAPGQLAAEPANVTVAQTFITPSLDPAESWSGWALTSHGVSENLFTVNREGKLVPLLADTIDRQSDGSWRVTVKHGVKFSDGSPLTAADVAAALNGTVEKSVTARAFAGRLTVTALDATTISIVSERPTPVMSSVLAEWTFVVYKFSNGTPIFTGPFEVKSFEPGAKAQLEPNSYYPGAEKRPAITLQQVADPQSLALGFKSGEFDLAFNLPSEGFPDHATGAQKPARKDRSQD